MGIWQKKLNRQISFLPSVMIILIFFITSVIIIYYTSVKSEAIVSGYSNLIIKRYNLNQENGQIIVTSPKINELLSVNFNLAGLAKVPEAKLQYRIVNGFNRILQQGTAFTNQPDVFSPFIVEINLEKTNLTPQGRIEVFTLNPFDNTEENYLSLPVNFK